MRKTGSFNRILIAVTVLIVNQAAALSVQASGKLVVNPMEFDCGVVDEGLPATMWVSIENVGDNKVEIQNVRTN